MELWSQYFGASPLVPIAKFDDTFREYFKTVQGNKHYYLLDYENEDVVTQQSFANILKKFGPLERIAETINFCFDHPAFHGFINADQANKLLKTEALNVDIEGTYVIRIASQDDPFALVADYVEGGAIKSINIFNHQDKGFSVTDTPNNTYTSLKDVIEQQSVLKTPYSRTFAKQRYFYWECPSKQADSILAGSPPGTFLLRFSSGASSGSRTGQISMAYVGSDGKVQHSHIPLLAGGAYELGKSKYDSVDDMIARSSFFKKNDKPFKCRSRGVAEEQTARVYASAAQTPMAAPVTLNYGDDTDYDAGYTPAGLGSYLKMPEMDTVPKVITGNSFPTIYQSTTNSQSFPVIVNPNVPKNDSEWKGSSMPQTTPSSGKVITPSTVGLSRTVSESGLGADKAPRPIIVTRDSTNTLRTSDANQPKVMTTQTNKSKEKEKEKEKGKEKETEKDKDKDKKAKKDPTLKQLTESLQGLSTTDIDELTLLKYSAKNPSVIKVLEACAAYAKAHRKK